MHYQPVVRLADRRPVMVEALARWHRPPVPISPNSFVPLAESTGLVRALSILVASRAAAEIAPLWQTLRLGVSVNLPLGLLLQRRPAGLAPPGAAGRPAAPGPDGAGIDRDDRGAGPSALRRALLRLRRAGYRVLLDDIVLQDERDWLLGLPFAAFKLDRSLVEGLPGDAQARREVRRLVRLAEAGGKQVIAEGVPTGGSGTACGRSACTGPRDIWSAGRCRPPPAPGRAAGGGRRDPQA